MAEELIIKCCAPTLAGLKMGSLFCLGSCDRGTACELKKCVEILNKKGLRVKGIRGKRGQRLIYIYRPEGLKKMIEKKENVCILQAFGYDTCCPERMLNLLMSRIRTTEDFPHEIGLFLGYPTEDVKGYIDNKGKNFKLCGMWKVYDDAERAEKCFSSYKKCTKVYMDCYKKGRNLEKLTVKSKAV